MLSIPAEQVAGIDFILHIIQHTVITVGDDGIAHGFKLLQIVDHQAAEEGSAIFQFGFMNQHSSSLDLYALHNAFEDLECQFSSTIRLVALNSH